MNKIISVAKWEFLEKIKTRAFLISMIVTPVIIIAFAIMPTLLENHETDVTKLVGVVDKSETYFSGLQEKLKEEKLSGDLPRYVLVNLTPDSQATNNGNEDIVKYSDNKVFNDKVNSYLLIKNGGTDSVRLQWRSNSTANYKDIRNFEQAFNEVRIDLKFKKKGIDTSLKKYLSSQIAIQPIKINKEGEDKESDFLTVFFSSFVFIILLMIMIMSSGGMLVRSLLEEKSNRLIEILVSSCTPTQLLTGKILGLSMLNLFQIVIWTVIGIALTGAATISPEIFENIGLDLVYFVLGFIFYTGIFVGLGATATTEQEAQQFNSYISMILILPIVFAISAIQNPNSEIVHILSYFPLTTPSIMLLRLNISPVPLADILTTILILIISIFISIYLSSKIFKIGILSYGKRPTLRELINWIKEK
jgi:ABC-2 type transport system permease protein